MSDNKEFKIEMGEALPCEFDYSLSVGELEKKLGEEYEKVESGKRKALTKEHAMLGYALDFVSFAKSDLETELDLSEESLPKFIDIIEMMIESFSEEKPADDILASWIKMTSGYLGCMILKNLGGAWVETNVGMAVELDGRAAFVQNKITNVLSGVEGDESDVEAVYTLFKEKNGE